MKNFLTFLFTYTVTSSLLFSQPRNLRNGCGGLNELPCLSVYNNSTRQYQIQPVDWSHYDMESGNAYCISGYVIGPNGTCIETPSANVSQQQALSNGCNTAEEVVKILQDAQKLITKDEKAYIAAQAVIDAVPTSGWMTKLDVTEVSTVYRGTEYHKDIVALTSGYLKSKSQILFDKENPISISDFWSRNGPQITANSSKELRNAFQIMACAKSYYPPSQFLSIALTFDVALPFAGAGYVYRFDAVPMSPILSLKTCSLIGGEVQYQIPNGTQITKLSRSRNNSTWEDFDSEQQKWTSDKDELKREVENVEIDGLRWTAKNISVADPNSLCFDNNDANCNKEGRLYTYQGAVKACETLGSGWRLPSDDDWLDLTRKYGGAYGDISDGTNAYIAMTGNGISDFNGTYGGKRYYFPDTQNYSFYDFGQIGYYWSSTKDTNNPETVIGYTFRSSDKKVLREGQPLSTYISVRCVKD